MKINITKKSNGVMDIELVGKFNIEKIQQFEEKITPLLSDKTKALCFNLAKTNYIDSSGLGVLMKTMNLAKNHSIKLVLYDLSETIDNIINLAHLENFFTIKDSDEIEDYINSL